MNRWVEAIVLAAIDVMFAACVAIIPFLAMVGLFELVVRHG